MNTQTQMSFEFAADLAKQLITLSTGILALTITFTKDLLKRVPSRKLWSLKLAWVGYFLTIVFGIFSLMALTGTLAPTGGFSGSDQIPDNTIERPEKPSVQEPNDSECLKIEMSARYYAGAQVLSFLFATVLVIFYGITTLKASKLSPDSEKNSDKKKKN